MGVGASWRDYEGAIGIGRENNTWVPIPRPCRSMGGCEQEDLQTVAGTWLATLSGRPPNKNLNRPRRHSGVSHTEAEAEAGFGCNGRSSDGGVGKREGVKDSPFNGAVYCAGCECSLGSAVFFIPYFLDIEL